MCRCSTAFLSYGITNGGEALFKMLTFRVPEAGRHETGSRCAHARQPHRDQLAGALMCEEITQLPFIKSYERLVKRSIKKTGVLEGLFRMQN